MEPWIYRYLVEHAPEGIIVADTEGVIRFWNAGAEAIFGFSADQAVGQSLDIIIPEAQRARHWDGYQRAMETGTTRYARDLLAVPALYQDGTRISVEFHVVLLRTEDGKLMGIAAILRDVTARWQEDRALRQQLRELQSKLDQLRQPVQE